MLQYELRHAVDQRHARGQHLQQASLGRVLLLELMLLGHVSADTHHKSGLVRGVKDRCERCLYVSRSELAVQLEQVLLGDGLS